MGIAPHVCLSVHPPPPAVLSTEQSDPKLVRGAFVAMLCVASGICFVFDLQCYVEVANTNH